MEITIEELINKYDEHMHSIEQNEKLVNDYNMDLEEILKAIELIEQKGNLLDQIKEYDKKLESLGSNYNLKNEDSINVLSIINDRKKIEDERDFLVNLKELLEQNNIKDLNSKDEILDILNKYKKNMSKEIESCKLKNNNSMLIIKNIGEIYKERLEEIEIKNSDRTQKLQFAENEIKPLIEKMRQTEIELRKYELFKNEGVLTHVQNIEINRLTNDAKEITKDFLEKLGQNTSLAEIINSTDMIKNYYAPYVYQLSNPAQEIEYNIKSTRLKELIREVEQFIENKQKQNTLEDKKKLNSNEKTEVIESIKTEQPQKKKYPIYEEQEIPYVYAEIVPEDEYKENQSEEEKIIDVEPEKLKTINENSKQTKESSDVLMNNIEKSSLFTEPEKKDETSMNVESKEQKNNGIDEFLKYLGKEEQENIPEQKNVTSQENTKNDEDINKSLNEVPNDILSKELFGTTEQNSIDFGIGPDQLQEQNMSNDKTDKLLQEILSELTTEKDSSLFSAIKKPFSIISKKIKRRTTESKYYTDRKDASVALSQELNIVQNDDNIQNNRGIKK